MLLHFVILHVSYTVFNFPYVCCNFSKVGCFRIVVVESVIIIIAAAYAEWMFAVIS